MPFRQCPAASKRVGGKTGRPSLSSWRTRPPRFRRFLPVADSFDFESRLVVRNRCRYLPYSLPAIVLIFRIGDGMQSPRQTFRPDLPAPVDTTERRVARGVGGYETWAHSSVLDTAVPGLRSIGAVPRHYCDSLAGSGRFFEVGKALMSKDVGCDHRGEIGKCSFAEALHGLAQGVGAIGRNRDIPAT